MKEFKDKFMTQAKFSGMVEDVVKNSNGLTNYIDAVVVVCDEYEIEIETVNKLISRPLKDKIKYNAQQLNLMNLLYLIEQLLCIYLFHNHILKFY